MKDTYTVRLEVFEGPLSLLMHLLEKHKVDIYDIPIAVITEQYLDYLRQMEKFNMEVASEFIVMAATLLQIKSRMLLPKPLQAEETEEEDPRQELVKKLHEYRKFKQIAALLEEMSQERSRVFTRLPQVFDMPVPMPEGLTVDDLLHAFAAVWESTAEDYALVAREEISVQEKMADILHVLRHLGGKAEFSQTLIRTKTKVEIVAAFMALLELIRLQRISISQQAVFEPIYIQIRECEV
mgnify:FL=1